MAKSAKLFWGIVVVAIVIIIVVVARTPATGPTVDLPQGPIKIGVVLPLTGGAAAYGIPLRRSGELAVQEVNAAGGIAGHQVEVIWQDGKCDPKDATAAAQKLINIDGVKIIFGGACSSETLAMAPIAEEAKVILMSPSATSPDVTTAGAFIFRTSPSDAHAGAIAAQYAYNKMDAVKAAVISENKDYAQGLRRVFKENFTKLGGEVVADETYNPGDNDFRTQILKIKNAKPDVIYIVPQDPPPGLLIMKQLNARGVTAPKRLTAEVLIGRNVVAENKTLMEGLTGIEPWFDEKGELAAALIKKYKDAYNEEQPFPSFQANMYSQFFLIKEAIEQYGLDTEKIRDWLYGVKEWKHALGSLTFDQNGDITDPQGLPYSIKEADGGELKEVEVVRLTVQ